MAKDVAHKVIVNYLKELCEKSITEKNPFIGICIDGTVRKFCRILSDIIIPDDAKEGIKQELHELAKTHKNNEFIVSLIEKTVKKI